MDDTLVQRIKDAEADLARMRAELEAEPALEANWHWRDSLETVAYHAMTSLSTED
jgi:hypothetical protein